MCAVPLPITGIRSAALRRVSDQQHPRLVPCATSTGADALVRGSRPSHQLSVCFWVCRGLMLEPKMPIGLVPRVTTARPIEQFRGAQEGLAPIFYDVPANVVPRHSVKASSNYGPSLVYCMYLQYCF